MVSGYGKDLLLANDSQLLDNQSNRQHARERIPMSHGGKGSKPRPIPDRKKFEDNWDSIFKKKEKCKHCFGIGYDASGQVCSCRDKK